MADRLEAKGLQSANPFWRANAVRVPCICAGPARKRRRPALCGSSLCEPGQAGRSNPKHGKAMLLGYRAEPKRRPSFMGAERKAASATNKRIVCQTIMCRGRLVVGRQPAKLFSQKWLPRVRISPPAIAVSLREIGPGTIGVGVQDVPSQTWAVLDTTLTIRRFLLFHIQ